MAFEQREGSGSLFKHDKEGNDRAPDYKGSIMINGTLYDLASWIKSSKDGKKKFMSLSAQPRRNQPAPSSGETVKPKVHPDFDDELGIPF